MKDLGFFLVSFLERQVRRLRDKFPPLAITSVESNNFLRAPALARHHRVSRHGGEKGT